MALPRRWLRRCASLVSHQTPRRSPRVECGGSPPPFAVRACPDVLQPRATSTDQTSRSRYSGSCGVSGALRIRPSRSLDVMHQLHLNPTVANRLGSFDLPRALLQNFHQQLVAAPNVRRVLFQSRDYVGVSLRNLALVEPLPTQRFPDVHALLQSPPPVRLLPRGTLRRSAHALLRSFVFVVPGFSAAFFVRAGYCLPWGR